MNRSRIEVTRSWRGLPLLLALFTLCLQPTTASADDWLVYLGGGLEPIEGGWQERDGQVLFRKPGGTLVSIGYSEVDLATSAFVTWQMNGRLEVPTRGPVTATEDGDGAADGTVAVTCAKARVKKLANVETLKVETGAGEETVHVACLDAPDTRHRFEELSWFGQVAQTSVEYVVRAGEEVCIAAPSALERDHAGHRIVYVTLANGKDYAAEVIGAGLGLLRIGPCERAPAYRKLEDRAIAGERGLWGERSEKPALAVASKTVAIGVPLGGVGMRGGGVVGRSGTLPPRRIGGG